MVILLIDFPCFSLNFLPDGRETTYYFVLSFHSYEYGAINGMLSAFPQKQLVPITVHSSVITLLYSSFSSIELKFYFLSCHGPLLLPCYFVFLRQFLIKNLFSEKLFSAILYSKVWMPVMHVQGLQSLYILSISWSKNHVFIFFNAFFIK